MQQTYLVHTVITSGIAPLFYVLAMSEVVRHKIDDKIYDIKAWVFNRWINIFRRGSNMVEDEEIALDILNIEEGRNMVQVEEIALEIPDIEEQSLTIHRSVFQNGTY